MTLYMYYNVRDFMSDLAVKGIALVAKVTGCSPTKFALNSVYCAFEQCYKIMPIMQTIVLCDSVKFKLSEGRILIDFAHAIRYI